MSLFNFNRVYSEQVWPSGIFSKIIQNNTDIDEQYQEYNVYGDQLYWSTIAQNPEYNRPAGN